MKMKKVLFVGFTLREVQALGINPEEEFSLHLAQCIADAVGYDIGTLIVPGGHVALIKGGAEDCTRKEKN